MRSYQYTHRTFATGQHGGRLKNNKSIISLYMEQETNPKATAEASADMLKAMENGNLSNEAIQALSRHLQNQQGITDRHPIQDAQYEMASKELQREEIKDQKNEQQKKLDKLKQLNEEVDSPTFIATEKNNRIAQFGGKIIDSIPESLQDKALLVMFGEKPAAQLKARFQSIDEKYEQLRKSAPRKYDLKEQGTAKGESLDGKKFRMDKDGNLVPVKEQNESKQGQGENAGEDIQEEDEDIERELSDYLGEDASQQKSIAEQIEELQQSINDLDAHINELDEQIQSAKAEIEEQKNVSESYSYSDDKYIGFDGYSDYEDIDGPDEGQRL